MLTSITVNGTALELSEARSVADLLSELRLNPAVVAVEINGDLLPREFHAERWLAAGDRIEIVTLVGGG